MAERVIVKWLAVLLTLSTSASADESLYDMDLSALLNVRIKSVSKFEEPLNESIVPVTLITQEMIRGSGSRTLKDLLTTFVPGMTFVQDQNEVNVAMRGVFTSSQQKILILLEGHRLNSRLISAANPDHSIGLDKIKHIEVIRGPGSSVYGNVALTAVINIVLIRGSELNGTESAIAIGNNGQKKLSVNWGDKLSDKGEFLGWFYGYENNGEKTIITPQNDYARVPSDENVEAIIGGFFDKPAYDIGLKLDYKNWSFLINKRRAHYVEPFSAANLTGEAYNYQDYQQRKGIGPGFQYTFTHLSVTHNTNFSENFNWENRIYYDESDMEATFIFNPSSQQFGLGAMYDRSRGLTSQLSWDKNWGSGLLGYQYDEVDVYKSAFPFGTGGVYSGELFNDDNPLVKPGKESVSSFYAMIKYHLSSRWLTNLGFRHDNKDRLTLSNQKNTSPRLGLIYFGDNEFQLKMSYSESFVDSPYWNRYGALPSFRGSETLSPEKLKSLQLTPSWQLFNGKMLYELNFFYNDLDDFVFRDNMAGPDEPINTNAGKMESWGHEHQLIYRADNWQARLVGFFNRVIYFDDFAAKGSRIHNVPNETVNFIFDYQWSERIKTSIQLNYTGKQLSPININLNGTTINDPFPNQGVIFQDPDNKLGGRTITNFSLTVNDLFKQNLTGEVHIFNLFDKSYQQGGTTLHPYPQEGRWFVAQLRYHF